MGIWNHLNPADLPRAAATPGELSNGARVSKHGTISFVRSGVARVHWDDGTTSEDWAADLVREDGA